MKIILFILLFTFNLSALSFDNISLDINQSTFIKSFLKEKKTTLFFGDDIEPSSLYIIKRYENKLYPLSVFSYYADLFGQRTFTVIKFNHIVNKDNIKEATTLDTITIYINQENSDELLDILYNKYVIVNDISLMDKLVNKKPDYFLFTDGIHFIYYNYRKLIYSRLNPVKENQMSLQERIELKNPNDKSYRDKF